MGKNVMVLGSTGLVGSEVVKFLLKNDLIETVICPVRKAQKLTNPKAKEIEIDFKDDATIEKLPSAEIIYCCLGTTIKKAGTRDKFKFVDYQLPIKFAHWGIKNKVHTYAIVTALGADANSLVFYNKVKGQVEQKLREFNFESLNIFRPSLLLGERGSESRFGEKVAETLLNFISPVLKGGLKKYAAIKASDVAKAMMVNQEKGLNIFLSDEIQKLADSSNI